MPKPIYSRVLLFLMLPLLAAALGAVTTSAQTEQFYPPAPSSFCAGERFSDVCTGDWFYLYVTDLANRGAISGYTDGTFRPYNEITRGQIMKVIVLSAGLTAPAPTPPTFADVPTTQTFYRWVEIGAANHLAAGYPCGSPGEPCDALSRPYFRPGVNVNRGQLSKMIVIGMAWTPLTPSSPTFADVPTTSAYYPYVERIAEYNIVTGYECGGVGEPCPGRYFRSTSTATRAQASKIIDRAHGFTPTPTVTGTPPTSTPVVVPTSTRPAVTPPVIGGCSVFPANNIWNKNISGVPTHVMSASYIASIGLSTGLHPDFGSGLWDGGPIGIPYISVPSGQPKVGINFTEYGDESDPGPYPVPAGAPIEGGPASTGDRHVLVVDQTDCTLYELYHSYPASNGTWDAGSGAKWSLNSNALRRSGWTSADAAGLPILPGLVRYDEVASGVIRHALRFTVQRSQQAFLWPARHEASSNTSASLPPMGLRVRLKASVDISGYPRQLRVILQALKDYGMFVADNGSSWYISGAPDERWDNDVLRQINTLHGSDFEAIDESSLMVEPNSGESR